MRRIAHDVFIQVAIIPTIGCARISHYSIQNIDCAYSRLELCLFFLPRVNSVAVSFPRIILDYFFIILAQLPQLIYYPVPLTFMVSDEPVRQRKGAPY